MTSGAAASALLLAGCADVHVLEPAGPQARRTASLGWVLFWAATAVTLVVFALLVVGLVRRRRREPSQGDRGAEWLVIAGGIVLPVVVLLPVVGYSVTVLDDRLAPDRLVVEAVGHQFWWEYRFPELGFTTANELHVPVGTPVELRMRSDDVIHSFWVPELGGKTDLVPGHRTTLRFEADTAGAYEGQCAEYCGLQHAKMRLLVIAESADDFEQWVRVQRRGADPPGSVAEGRVLFETEGCAGCHTVRGTDADGELGPDLTHVAGRRMLAANVIPNTPDQLRRWLAETWEVKGRITMPEVPLSAEEVEAIARYLEALR